MRSAARWLIPLCGLLAYFTALANPFEFDDEYVVRDNLLLHEPGGLERLWTAVGLTAGPVLPHYRPLTMSSFWLGRRLHGDAVIGHRTVNLALHVACAYLVMLFAVRLLRRMRPNERATRAHAVGLVAGLLFVLHPINSPVVSQIFKRTSSLCTLLMLAALLCLDAALPRPADGVDTDSADTDRVRPWLLVSSLACAAVALLAKESAAVMPPLVLLYAARTGAFVLRSRRGVALVASFCVLPALFALAFFPHGAIASGEHAALRHLLAQPRVMLDYAAMLVLPERVPIAMGVAPAAWPPVAADVIGVLLLLLLVVAAVACFRRLPLASFAVLWAAVCLAPTSTLVPMNLTGDPVRMYEAGIGLAIAAAAALLWLAERIADRVPVVAGRARGWIAALPVLFASLYLWFGTLALGARHAEASSAWRHAAQLYPGDPVIANNWCVSERDEALVERVCRRAIELQPDNRYAMPKLVTQLARNGRFAEAETELARGRARLGDDARVYLAEARLAWLQQDLPRAHDAFRNALMRDPASLEARLYLADVRLRLGLPDARPLVEDITGVPGSPTLQAMLASVRARLR